MFWVQSGCLLFQISSIDRFVETGTRVETAAFALIVERVCARPSRQEATARKLRVAMVRHLCGSKTENVQFCEISARFRHLKFLTLLGRV